eukprot:6006767-Amphidinium_carterae.2
MEQTGTSSDTRGVNAAYEPKEHTFFKQIQTVWKIATPEYLTGNPEDVESIRFLGMEIEIDTSTNNWIVHQQLAGARMIDFPLDACMAQEQLLETIEQELNGHCDCEQQSGWHARILIHSLTRCANV